MTSSYTGLAVVRPNGNGHDNGIIFFKSKQGRTSTYGLMHRIADDGFMVGQDVAGAWGDRVFVNVPGGVPNGEPYLLVARFGATAGIIELSSYDVNGLLESASAGPFADIDPGGAVTPIFRSVVIRTPSAGTRRSTATSAKSCSMEAP